MKNMELLTVRELVECIGRRLREEASAAGERQRIDAEDIWQYGLRRKWLESADLSHREALIERRQAARIFHGFLKWERQEQDLAEWEAAKCLLDLYDCRTCVDHVAQVYSKGIMDGITEHIFGMREGILKEELEPMAERLFDREKRKKR